jgi:hypothetical protein
MNLTCSCLEGFSDFKGVFNDCDLCNYRCLSCTNPFECSLCHSTRNASSECDCKLGLFEHIQEKNPVCKVCPIECYYCVNETTC